MNGITSIRFFLFCTLFLCLSCHKENDVVDPPVDPPTDKLIDTLNAVWKGNFNGTVYQHHHTPGWPDGSVTNNSVFRVISFEALPEHGDSIRFSYKIDDQPNYSFIRERTIFQDSIIFFHNYPDWTFFLDRTKMHIHLRTYYDYSQFGGSTHEYIWDYYR